jgi:hypothetical protein
MAAPAAPAAPVVPAPPLPVADGMTVPAVLPVCLTNLFPRIPGAAAPAATFRNLPDLKIPRYDGLSSFDHFLQAFSNASRLIVMSAQQLSNLFIQHLSPPLAMEFQKIVNDNAPLSFWQHVYVI